MGAITGLLGLGGGAGGTGTAGPQQANIGYETNNQQVNNAYQSANQGLLGQQALLQALQGQNGLGNQNQVYGQLQNVAAGQGPNPATALLSNATGANNAAQAALMAGQRGASANTGLIARQAAQQGAANQQSAVGQAAALQAQQSLGALGQAGALANQQAGQQIAGTGALTSATQAEQQNILNAQAAQNNAMVNSQGSVNAANSALANTQAKGQQGLLGGVLGGIGSALGAAKAAGGEIQQLADGGLSGATNAIVPVTSGTPRPGMLSSFLSASGVQIGNPTGQAADPLTTGLTQLGGGIGHLLASPAPQQLQMPTTGTQLPADNSAAPTETAMAAEGGKIKKTKKMADGGETKHTASNPNESSILVNDAADKKQVTFRSPTSVETTDDRGQTHDFDPKNVDPSVLSRVPMTAGPTPSTYAPTEAPASTNGPRSSVGKILSGVFSGASASSTLPTPQPSPSDTLLKALGGETDVGSKLKKGGHVPGQPKVPGPVNSYDNDTVNAKLSPGEIVIPNSVTKSADPVRGAAEFVARTVAKKKMRGGK